MIRMEWEQVREVLLADGWHAVERGTFRIDPVQIVPSNRHGGQKATEWPDGFTFEASDGNVYAGPLSSVLAVSRSSDEKPTRSAHHDLAQRLHGEILMVDATVTVRFSHADREFDVWLDESGSWRFIETRLRGTSEAVETYLQEADVDALMRLMMGELKALWGRGQSPVTRADEGDDEASAGL